MFSNSISISLGLSLKKNIVTSGIRGKDSVWGDDGSSGGAGADNFFSEGQLQELESMELNVDSRNVEIKKIAQSVQELHTIFKELAVLVIDQGELLM